MNIVWATLLFTGLVLAMSAVPGPGHAQAAGPAKVTGPKVKWDLSSYGTPRSSTHSQTALARMVSEATGGNFQINIHFGAGLAPNREVIDGIAIGAYQMGYFAASFHPGKTPAMLVLELPFLPFDSMEHFMGVTLATWEHPVLVEEMARWNAYHLLPSILPSYELVGRGTPPTNLADLRGKRIRALGGPGGALKTVGAVPTSLVTPEIYGGFERGLLDAAAVGLAWIRAYKFEEVTHWYTTNLRMGAPSAASPVNRHAFDALPPQYKQLLKAMVVPATREQIVVTKVEDAQSIEVAAKRGMKEVRYPEAVAAEFARNAGQPVWDEWVAEWTPKGLPARELLDFVIEQAKKQASS